MQAVSDKNLTNVNIGIFLKIEICEGGSSFIRVNTVFAQPVKKFPAFYETQRFITVFTRACRNSLS
jgi:hypothetical protein